MFPKAYPRETMRLEENQINCLFKVTCYIAGNCDNGNSLNLAVTEVLVNISG